MNLTSVAAKGFESVIKDKVLNHLANIKEVNGFVPQIAAKHNYYVSSISGQRFWGSLDVSYIANYEPMLFRLLQSLWLHSTF